MNKSAAVAAFNRAFAQREAAESAVRDAARASLAALSFRDGYRAEDALDLALAVRDRAEAAFAAAAAAVDAAN